MAVLIGGSRRLQSSSTLAALVQVLQASGQVVHVGCCVGADAQVIQAGMWSPSFLVVFAAFAQGGLGAWPGSAVSAVCMAGQAGAQVRFLAGGSLAVPLSGRLIRRSCAALAGCSQAVFFEPGAGSFAVIRQAIKAGVPVFVFQAQAPTALAGGSWVRAQFYRFPCWQFKPQAVQPGLF